MAGERLLTRTEFGNPILQTPARLLTPEEIASESVQALIQNMRYTLRKKKLGVGLAAPQVGEPIALSVIDIQPRPHRPEVEPFTQVIINPKIIRGIGEKASMWEGCLSLGRVGSPVFAQTVRFEEIEVEYYDERAVWHEGEMLMGLPAQVFQHETDHLNGIIFPERVEDHTTWMTAKEYRERIIKPKEKNARRR